VGEPYSTGPGDSGYGTGSPGFPPSTYPSIGPAPSTPPLPRYQPKYVPPGEAPHGAPGLPPGVEWEPAPYEAVPSLEDMLRATHCMVQAIDDCKILAIPDAEGPFFEACVLAKFTACMKG